MFARWQILVCQAVYFDVGRPFLLRGGVETYHIRRVLAFPVEKKCCQIKTHGNTLSLSRFYYVQELNDLVPLSYECAIPKKKKKKRKKKGSFPSPWYH